MTAKSLTIDLSGLKRQENLLGDNGIMLIDLADPIGVAGNLFNFSDFMVKAFTDRVMFKKLLDLILYYR